MRGRHGAGESVCPRLPLSSFGSTGHPTRESPLRPRQSASAALPPDPSPGGDHRASPWETRRLLVPRSVRFAAGWRRHSRRRSNFRCIAGKPGTAIHAFGARQSARVVVTPCRSSPWSKPRLARRSVINPASDMGGGFVPPRSLAGCRADLARSSGVLRVGPTPTSPACTHRSSPPPPPRHVRR